MDAESMKQFGATVAELERAEKLWKEAYQAAAQKASNESGRAAGGRDKMGDTKYDLKEDGAYVEEGKDENRRAFLERSNRGARKTGKVGEVAFSYLQVGPFDTSFTAEQVERELSALGIKSFYHDGLEWNQNGKTHVDTGATAAIGNEIVGIRKDVFGNAKNFAGHEAYHVWGGSANRAAYDSVIRDNINMLTPYALKLASDVDNEYFKGNITSKADFVEEYFAKISGQIHSGQYDDKLSTMFKDYGAVKAAWNALVAQNANGKPKFSLKDSQGRILQIPPPAYGGTLRGPRLAPNSYIPVGRGAPLHK